MFQLWSLWSLSFDLGSTSVTCSSFSSSLVLVLKDWSPSWFIFSPAMWPASTADEGCEVSLSLALSSSASASLLLLVMCSQALLLWQRLHWYAWYSWFQTSLWLWPSGSLHHFLHLAMPLCNSSPPSAYSSWSGGPSAHIWSKPVLADSPFLCDRLSYKYNRVGALGIFQWNAPREPQFLRSTLCPLYSIVITMLRATRRLLVIFTSTNMSSSTLPFCMLVPSWRCLVIFSTVPYPESMTFSISPSAW